MATSPNLKPLVWIASSKADLMRLPRRVVRKFGFGLYLAQGGETHQDAKPLKGFGSAGVLEIVEDWKGNAYRAAYTARLGEAVFGLRSVPEKVQARDCNAQA